jgi:hypothetical protein
MFLLMFLLIGCTALLEFFLLSIVFLLVGWDWDKGREGRFEFMISSEFDRGVL